MDELFLRPFLTGLCLALFLPWLGNLLRLRDEWFATLGLAHLSAAGAMLAQALGISILVGSPLGALCGALAKLAAGARSNAAYGVMMLAGWSATLLVAANGGAGEALGHALIDGQLYFSGPAEALIACLLLVGGAVLLPLLTPRLIAAVLFPANEKVNRLPAWRWHLGFECLVVIAVAIATASIGLMACFALLFVPAWVSFGRAVSWRQGVLLSIVLGLGCYVVAFFAALRFDQPFGPVLVGLLVMACLGLRAGLSRRHG